MKLQSTSLRIMFAGAATGAVLLVVVPATMIVAGLSRSGDYLSSARGSTRILRATDSVERAVVEMQKALQTEPGAAKGTSAERYREADKKARAGLKELGQLVSGNPKQLKHVQEAEALLSRLQGSASKPVTEQKLSVQKTTKATKEQQLSASPSDQGSFDCGTGTIANPGLRTLGAVRRGTRVGNTDPHEPEPHRLRWDWCLFSAAGGGGFCACQVYHQSPHPGRILC